MLQQTFFVTVLIIVIHGAIGKTLGFNRADSFDQELEFKDSDEIVGGEVVDITQFPFQASLTLIDMPWCGGSIISEDYILTAAHCCLNKKTTLYKVRVGSSNQSKGGQVHNIAKIIRHPHYNVSQFDNDVAILKLTEKIALNGVTAKPVQLASSDSVLKPGDNIIVTGWGTTENNTSSELLRAVTVPVTTRESCAKAYRDTTPITDRMVCAGLNQGGKDACQGDSGGPAVDEKSLTQYGIVSFGEGCALPDYPGVYAYIPPLRDWIKEVTGI